MSLFTLAFAQMQTDAPAAGGGQGSFLVLLPMYLIIFFVFYFFLMRPQQKKQQEHQNMISQVKKNDEVITSSGIHATVVNVKDKTVVLRVDEGTKIEFEKNMVSTIKKSRQS